MFYRAVYKCSDSLISESEIRKCLRAFARGKFHYKSCSGRNDVYKYKGHYYCKDGSFGVLDFQGFKKIGE